MEPWVDSLVAQDRARAEEDNDEEFPYRSPFVIYRGTPDSMTNFFSRDCRVNANLTPWHYQLQTGAVLTFERDSYDHLTD